MQLPSELSYPCDHVESEARTQLEIIRWPKWSYCPTCGSFDRVELNAATGSIQSVLNAGTIAAQHGVIQSKAAP
jgi:hypothetical protein